MTLALEVIQSAAMLYISAVMTIVALRVNDLWLQGRAGVRTIVMPSGQAVAAGASDGTYLRGPIGGTCEMTREERKEFNAISRRHFKKRDGTSEDYSNEPAGIRRVLSKTDERPIHGIVP